MQSMINKVLAGVLALMVLVASCKKKDNEYVCSYDPCSLKASDAEVKQVEAYLTANGINAVKHCSGMYYLVSDTGTGSRPTSCSAVAVTYKGSLANGNVFDKATTPVSFSLVTLIEGWKMGIPLIKSGGKIKLIIPPSLGYGPAANQGIPANSVLIFDIDLLDVR